LVVIKAAAHPLDERALSGCDRRAHSYRNAANWREEMYFDRAAPHAQKTREKASAV
jgi:hypothetical protein